MSRIGRKVIAVPQGVELQLKGQDIQVKGSKGSLDWVIPAGIEIAINDNQISVSRTNDERQTRAFHGLTRATLANMVQGVSDGFQKSLQIEGVGYRAALKGNVLELALGYSHPVEYPVPAGIEIVVESPTLVHIKGSDRQQVGQVAAEIREKRPPEPYKGKGVRYVGERILRKAGKAGSK